MKVAIGCLIGLVFVVSVSAEPLLEGRVRLDSGEPVADAQVRIFDMTDLRQGAIARALTDGTGYFALPLAALTGQALPARFALGPNYPNPFNPSTIIPYQLAASSAVRLEVFNLLGQRIATLVDGERPAGFHKATWHATDGSGRAVGAGVYIYRMTVGVESQTGRMVLIDGQAGVSAAGAASVMPGASGIGRSDGADAHVYGLIVSGSGLVPYVDSSFRVEAGMAPVELVVSSGLPSAGKVTDDDCAFCDLFGTFNDQQEEEEDETEEEEDETDSTSSEGGPDMVVQTPSVSAVMLTPGQEFTLHVTVHNQGDEQAAATTLHYYRSNNATITSSDTEVGTDEIGVLDASATSAASIALTAPTSVSAEEGTYYGACVASVSGESNTDNNCSSAVKITVSGQVATEEESDETLEEEEEAAEEESSETEEGDMIVSTSVNDNILTTGQAFLLRATVQNQGTEESPELVLSYYRSSNATISTQDTQVGTDAVSSLDASSIRNESIRLTAPSTPGTYYYGACVASISGESDTPSSCSTGVSVIVEEDDGADGQDGDLVFTDPQIYNDNVFVLPVAENLAAGLELPLKDYAARFYEHFNDEFDFLIFVPNMAKGEQEWDGAFFIHVKNDVQGIGLSIFSDNSSWGSAGKLQGITQFMGYFGTASGDSCPGCSDIRSGTLLHEIMHQWGNFIVPITSYPYGAHWGFSSSGGYLDGYDISNMIDHGDGNFSHEFIPRSQYSPIELYLAGFIPPEEVPDFQIAEDAEWLFDERDIVEDDNGYRMFTASGFKTYTIEDIIAEHGPRVPDHSQAQKDFRSAVILLVSEDYPASQERLEWLSDDVSWISYVGETNTVWSGFTYSNFYEATGGRGTITMDDLSHFQRDASAKRLVPSSFGTPLPPIVDRRE